MFRSIHRFLIGRPLLNWELSHEKLPKWKALPIFSSDAISSVGYGPEQIALVLAVPGLLAYGYIPIVVLAVLVLLAIVTLSYAQVARANPGGRVSLSSRAPRPSASAGADCASRPGSAFGRTPSASGGTVVPALRPSQRPGETY